MGTRVYPLGPGGRGTHVYPLWCSHKPGRVQKSDRALRTTRMSFEEHKRIAAMGGVTITWGQHKDYLYKRMAEELPYLKFGTRDGFNAFLDAFGDRHNDRIIKSESLRNGMTGPYTLQGDGHDLVLHYRVEHMEEGQEDQKIAMRSVGITARTPGLIGRLQTMARARDTAILYCGDGNECIPIPACGPWVLADGRVISNQFGFAKHLVEHYKDPSAAEKALEDAIAEESRKATAIMEQQIYPMLDNTEFQKAEAALLKDHINLSARRRLPEIDIDVSPGALLYLQQNNADLFCGDSTGFDPFTLMILRQSSVLIHSINWVNRSCILPVKLFDLIPEVHIGSCSNFVYQIPSRTGSYIVFKEQADQYRRRILAVIHRGLHSLSAEERLAQEARAEQGRMARADLEARAAAREEEAARLEAAMLETHRLRIDDARQCATSKKAKVEAAWHAKWKCTRPEVTSLKKEEVRVRQEARQVRLSQGKQLDKATFTADKSPEYQQGLQRDDVARAQKEKKDKQVELAKKKEKEAHRVEAKASAAAAERAQVIPSHLTLVDFLPAWEKQEDH